MIIKYLGTEAINAYVLVEAIVFLISIGFSSSLARSANIFI